MSFFLPFAFLFAVSLVSNPSGTQFSIVVNSVHRFRTISSFDINIFSSLITHHTIYDPFAPVRLIVVHNRGDQQRNLLAYGLFSEKMKRLSPVVRIASSIANCGVNTTRRELVFSKGTSPARFLASSSSTNREVAPSATALSSVDGVVGEPIDFDVAAKIEGNESQIVTIELRPNQVLRAESGAMMYMTDGVEMNTTTGGGLSAGFRRMMTGQNFFISDYTYTGDNVGRLALGTDFPSKIMRLNVPEYGGKLVCQKGALLCASHTVDVQMEFTENFKSGFFGGEGFVLQALTGEGDVFLKAGGTLIRRDLRAGEELRISSGCLVAFTHQVEYGEFKRWLRHHVLLLAVYLADL